MSTGVNADACSQSNDENQQLNLAAFLRDDVFHSRQTKAAVQYMLLPHAATAKRRSCYDS